MHSRIFSLFLVLLLLLLPLSLSADEIDYRMQLDECVERLERSVTERQRLTFVIEKQRSLLVDQTLFIKNLNKQLTRRDEALNQIESSLSELEHSHRTAVVRTAIIAGSGGAISAFLVVSLLRFLSVGR